MSVEHINVPLEIKQLNEPADPNFFFFEGYASTFGNVDLGGDVMVVGAFKESLAARTPKLLWQHDMDDPIGVITEAGETATGLFVKGKLPKMDTLVAGRVIPQMTVGSVDTMSIGFTIAQDGFHLEGGNRYITKCDLWEVSLVTLAMNPQAAVTNMKRATRFSDLPLAPRDHAWDSRAAVRRVRDFTNSTDAPSARYRRAFFWYDAANEENFGAYKLPFADVINGKLVAVPRAIFAAAAVMRGARGGVDIPEADRRAVENHINRYYDKLGMDSPLKAKGLGVEELETLTPRELEDLLRDTGVFSRKGATFIASKVSGGQRDAGDPEQRDAVEELAKGLSELLAELKSSQKQGA